MKRKTIAEKVIDYIYQIDHKHFSQVSVNNLAEKFNITASHLSRSFKLSQEMSLKDFIIREKIVRCRYILIRYPHLLVKEISDLIDFNSCDYFIKVFKRIVGVSPGKYRAIGKSFSLINDRRIAMNDRRELKTEKIKWSTDHDGNEFLERRKRLKDRRKKAAYSPEFYFEKENSKQIT